MNNKFNLGLIILSSSGYEEVAIKNLELLLENFNTNPFYEIFLATSYEYKNNDSSIKIISDTNFTARLQKSLNNLESDFVLLWLDDFRCKFVNQNLFFDSLDILKKNNAGACKLFPVERPEIPIPGNSNFGIYDNRSLGRLNTQPTIYKKKYLLDLLSKNESLWQFENNHNVRSLGKSDLVLGSYRKIINYNEVIRKGKFFRKYKIYYGNNKIKKLGFLEEKKIQAILFVNRFLIKIFGYPLLIRVKRFLI